MRLATARHQVDPAVAVEVGGYQVLGGDPAFVDDVAVERQRPAGARLGVVDQDAHQVRLPIEVVVGVAARDGHLVVAVAVEIRAPQGMRAGDLAIDHAAVPQAPAQQLRPGDLLRSADGGSVAVEAVASGEAAAVYNLRVAEYHTYFVGDAAWGFAAWVHNMDYEIEEGSNRSRVNFDGMEVRAVRDLSHLSDGTLAAMAENGFAAKLPDVRSIVLHHHRQNPAGPIIEMPANRHSIGNPAQHPFGNAAGSGLTAGERSSFNTWRENFWRARARQEIARRGT